MKGGLGNQMFQYALGLHLSIRFSRPLYVDVTHYKKQTLREFELDVFGIECKQISGASAVLYHTLIKTMELLNVTSRRIFIEKTFAFDPSVFNEPAPVYLKGFFQSYKYFADISSVVRDRFAFFHPLDKPNNLIASEIATSNSVSIHIRRGDYTYWHHYDSSHVMCSLDYYKQAVELIKQKTRACTFFIFTDDPEWVKSNLYFDYTLVEGNIGQDSWKDMYLMSLCKHHIIANSTFSWWAAWLNPSASKIVISPRQWFGNEMNEDTKDLCPDDWIRI